MEWDDAIAAVATAYGPASIAVIRVSGRDATGVVDRVFRGARPLSEVPSHTVWHGMIVNPATGEALDEVLATVMRAPRTYTTQDVVEVGTHGGLATVNAVLSVILRAGARLADPGEFTKRAFLGGRLDLSQAEGVMELISAQSEAGRRAALQQVQGSLTRAVREIRVRLLDAMAGIEVAIDYPEHDAETATAGRVGDVADESASAVGRLLETAANGRILREGLRTVIVGRPNAGKSSLLNELTRSDRAIVTDVPGTTRDVLEERVQIGGIPFLLLDTAGIRETDDAVERIGVSRSLEALSDAEIVLLVIDGSRPLEDEDRILLERIAKRPSLALLSKKDQGSAVDPDDLSPYMPASRVIPYSVFEQDIAGRIGTALKGLAVSGGVRGADATFVANARHIRLLESARDVLLEAARAARSGLTLDLVAVPVQEAWRILGELIGESPGEDLLDHIFQNFCLGK